jgi:hypothetical protein
MVLCLVFGPVVSDIPMAGLVAVSARSQGGFRLYTEADIARLMVIRGRRSGR